MKMSGKQIFIWSIIFGLALSGGIAGIVGLVLWVTGFWVLEKAYEAVEAFYRGWKSSANERASTPKPRPALRVIKGGA